MSKFQTYRCDRCKIVDPDTIFSGDKYASNGWLQVSQDVHYCPSCQDKYDDFLVLDWAPGVKFYKPCVILFEGKKYDLISEYVFTVVGHEPPKVPSVYVLHKDPNVILEWVRPSGAHDAYQLGDKFTYKGSTYEVIVSNFVHSPEEYPQGVKKI